MKTLKILSAALVMVDGLSVVGAAAFYLAGPFLAQAVGLSWQPVRGPNGQQAMGFALIYFSLCLVAILFWAKGRGWCRPLLLYLACLHVLVVAAVLAANQLLWKSPAALIVSILMNGMIFVTFIRDDFTRRQRSGA